MATLKDIAKRAKVSQSAVSRILNQDATLSVSPETRERVFQIASELGYRKKHLEYHETCIGIFQWFSEFQEMQDPYYQNIRMGIEKYCADHQIQVVRTYQSDPGYLDALKNVNALICIGKFDSTQIKTFEAICPHVLFVDMQTLRIHCNTISLDFRQAVVDVLDYLTELGHKKIAYFGGQEILADNSVYSDDRKHTFISYCLEHGLIFEPYLKEAGYQSEAGYQMALELMEGEDLPTAVFAASDPIAIGALKAFREKGLCVPEDISIVGFDDIDLASFTIPALTTVKAPAQFMGEYAAHFISMSSGSTEFEYRTPVRLTLPCELIIRDSCRKIL